MDGLGAVVEQEQKDGASGVQPRSVQRAGSSLGGLEPPKEIFAVGEREHRPAPRTTDEQAQLLWQKPRTV